MAKLAVKHEGPVSADLLALHVELASSGGAPLAQVKLGSTTLELRTVGTSIWAIIRSSQGEGGYALRAVYSPLPFNFREEKAAPREDRRYRVITDAGEYRIALAIAADGREQFRMRTCFTPSVPTLIPYVPRDLVPLGRRDDPLATTGTIEAQQRGLNAALLYFRVDKPDGGTALYYQDLTSLNPYLRATGTRPEEIVGAEWPELGLRLPTYVTQGVEPKPLEPGQEMILSDAVLVLRSDHPAHERESARQFLQMLGAAYEMIEHPPTQFHDWVERARRTVEDIAHSPKATVRHYGNLFVHPYTDAEYPDSMVQISLIAALHGWGEWQGKTTQLEQDLAKGLRHFYDPKLSVLRRWLPNVGDDKDATAVDSWYLYHPLLNLGILALRSDEQARALFFDSLDYGIRAAHHFDYRWPVEYDVRDFSIITDVAPVDGRGQTDVGGIYAWVMLQAFELTDDPHYIDEAKAAIDAAIGLRFDINYQANLTAWGAAACMRLWRITNQRCYLEQGYVYLASFFHNSIMWESELGHAAHYQTFMAVTCLQDAPYMAMYECFDTFVAFEQLLNDGGPDLEPAARMLVSEYCKYALSRAWYYYPDALPKKAIAGEQRDSNGHIDCTLSFPVEDLYPDGQPAGQVGQEVYGAGGALVFASRMFHPIDGAPFRLFCNHFIRATERIGEKALSITLDGGDTRTADVSLIRLKRRKFPDCKLMTAGGDLSRPREETPDGIDFAVPARGRLILTWE